MSVEKRPKQVIVIRRDLKMRRGKEIAQGSHASMMWLLKRVLGFNASSFGSDQVEFTPAEAEWVRGQFTKITLQVPTEAELLKVYEDAKAAGLEVHLITDAGATEFHGVPTKTCLAIGPDYADKIDPVTANLRLY